METIKDDLKKLKLDVVNVVDKKLLVDEIDLKPLLKLLKTTLQQVKLWRMRKNYKSNYQYENQLFQNMGIIQIYLDLMFNKNKRWR